MKNITIVLIGILFLFSSCGGEGESKETALVEGPDRVEVIDFYGTHRCITCEAIETNAQYTVETFFKEEVETQKLVFKTISVDEEVNYEMAERFEATGTALFINIVKEGKETHIDLTDLGFSKGKERDAFSIALRTEIETALKQL